MIVDFTLEQPTLLRSLRQGPPTEVVWEQTDTTDNEERLVLFWAESEDFEAFEEAMAGDPTVTAPRCLVSVSGRRLYQVEQVREGRAQSVYPTLVEVGGVVRELTADRDGWHFQVMFPDQDALSRFHDTCTDHGIALTLHQKYEESPAPGDGYDYGLSDKQCRTLRHAVEQGYYEVPRRTDLDTIAEEMDVSHQAASERLRRAIDVLVRRTIGTDREEVEPSRA
jgi:hypothetical protein